MVSSRIFRVCKVSDTDYQGLEAIQFRVSKTFNLLMRPFMPQKIIGLANVFSKQSVIGL
jgi:hypothetical protein